MDFNITFQALVGNRGTYRATIPGLTVRLSTGQICAARDISASGVGFTVPDGCSLVEGQLLVLDILVADRLYIQSLEATVVRMYGDTVASAFRQLSRMQEARLDKLVLETQKRLIARRKAQAAALDEAFAQLPPEDSPPDEAGKPITLNGNISID